MQAIGHAVHNFGTPMAEGSLLQHSELGMTHVQGKYPGIH